MASGGNSSQHKTSDSLLLQKGSDFMSSVHTMETEEQCLNHKDNKLELFCEDHNVLICSRCHITSHNKCTEHVVLIDDKVKTMQQNGDFTKLIEEINALKQELYKKKQDLEGNAEQLQMAFEEQLNKINTLRKKFNETLDQLESNTIKELNTLLEILKAPLQDDIDKCIDALSRIQNIQDEIQNIDKNTETLKLLLFRKYSEKSSEIESMKSQMVSNRLPTIKFIPDSSIECIFSLSSFGKWINPNEILEVTENTKYGLPRAGIFSFRGVSAICETANGALLITYRYIEEVILLDEEFKLVNYYKLPSQPCSMCGIDSSLVAVALDNKEVHIIRVNNVGQLVLDRKMTLEHKCFSMAHHKGFLYIPSDKALYHYTVCGRLVRKIYEDVDCFFVEPVGGGKQFSNGGGNRCSISPDGTQLYVANGKKLITLSIDGTVINTLSIGSDLCGLCVTDSGQVLVSVDLDGYTILQVDKDGRQIVADLKKDVTSPIYYSKHRGALIGGTYTYSFGRKIGSPEVNMSSILRNRFILY